jgi:hypothetical protein
LTRFQQRRQFTGKGDNLSRRYFVAPKQSAGATMGPVATLFNADGHLAIEVNLIHHMLTADRIEQSFDYLAIRSDCFVDIGHH